MAANRKTMEERIATLERAAEEFAERLLRLSREVKALTPTKTAASTVLDNAQQSVALSDMTRAELFSIAAAMQIPDCRKMTQAELVEKITEARAGLAK